MTRAFTLVLAALMLGAWGAGPACGRDRGALVILRGSDSDNYDPVRSTARASGEVLEMMGDTLTSMDWDLKTVRPGLAQSWDVSPGGLTYVFHLRAGVRFCDGRPMTAEDVAYSLNRLVAPATHSPVAWRAGPVETITASDPLTVRYQLKRPYGELLAQLSLFFTTIVDRHAVETLGRDFGVRGFNGTGPYCWGGWQPRQELVLHRHRGYDWGPPVYHSPVPQIDTIVWRVIPDDTSRLIALQSDQGDVSQYMPYYAIDGIARTSGLHLAGQPAYRFDYILGFKITKPVVGDPVIRRALQMAVDRKALASAVFFGQADAADDYINPNAPDAVPVGVAAYDPEGARRLLEAHGWVLGPDGVRVRDGQRASFTLYAFSDPTDTILSEVLQAYFHKVGIEMVVQLWDATIGWSKLGTQEFGAFIMGYPYFSAHEALNLFFSSHNIPTPNRMNWRDPETDRLLADASAAVDPAVRRDALTRLQEKLTQSDLWIPLGREKLWEVSSDRVQGVRAHGLYGIGLYKGLDMRLSP
ncbi:diguanylate cyclase [Gluconacetobacter liquefaciens]|uniref:ABC transporter substrate-binding protein n=1 Tax=Gluconacetobacter liquefaciens TaxID=89584 RepID=A0A370G787_GLULI|nr:ABC transporter substrate-binding protein [Gluconacetobacter liquefaciens]MBB2185859.1 ABC transporter substrate-binding protein [Gluconacetobacter liquefaciens]RDI39671.1 peptide/nickel transport system substrate-binding protein [Gluconacetobacter liquefaciens]GBR03658.1 peptide ABC transporter ATP-binding protein [Gluconacetobacter liquefaciens NRIC 0522]GEB36309.1 diguanylate cyclase [Gluconacetobacter liquefaciens]